MAQGPTKTGPSSPPTSLWSGAFAIKAKYAFYSALVFFLIANPETYKLSQHVFGLFLTTSVNGCPTPSGLVFHTVLFFILFLGLMLVPRDTF